MDEQARLRKKDAADTLIDDAIIIVEGIMNFITRRREKRKKEKGNGGANRVGFAGYYTLMTYVSSVIPYDEPN